MTSLSTYPTWTDQFCGCGGSAEGCEASGGEVLVGINHWKLALQTYAENHPRTRQEHGHCGMSVLSEPNKRGTVIAFWEPTTFESNGTLHRLMNILPQYPCKTIDFYIAGENVSREIYLLEANKKL